MSPTVTIIVGEASASQTFYVHKDLLVPRSSFFQKALKDYGPSGNSDNNIQPDKSDATINGWREGSTGTIELPEDKPEIFKLYVHLLYFGSLPVREDPKELPATDISADAASTAKGANVGSAAVAEFRKLAELYVFCEKVQDLERKCTAMAAMIEATKIRRADSCRYYPGHVDVSILYSGTMPSDPMREFLVKCAVVIGDEKWINNDVSLYPAEYLCTLASSLMKHRPSPPNIRELNIEDTAMYCNEIRAVGTEATEANGKKAEITYDIS